MIVEEIENKKESKVFLNRKDFISHIMQIKRYVKLQKLLGKYIQHGKTSVYIHSRNVAYLSYLIAGFCEKNFNAQINYDILIVGAMFHDFFLYDWHESEGRPNLHGFKHPKIASINAQKYYNINEETKEIIESHMWPLTITKFPKSLEAKIVCLADKLCSAKETIVRF